MKTVVLITSLFICSFSLVAQGPAVTSWLQNTSITGTYYMAGNSTPVGNSILVNCQEVAYSTTYVYVTTEGVPSYPTGPFLDGNPSQASAQGQIYRFPLSPQANTGTPTATTPGSVGIFINGVSLYDYRDGVAWNPSTSALCGGPGNPPCPGGMGAVMDWNRDAIPAEMDGFDCSKGHPAMGNYHHHQNPSAFNLDINVVSSICNLYDADGLYGMDSTQHSPLIGFAYDGYPIYGAYGFQNSDGSGGVKRILSGYQLRSITNRTHLADGTDVDDGPSVSATYFLGYFREDYEYNDHVGQDEYLDEHNGRFCITPEYPAGTYAYFCTVDENWNSAYPYAVGPTFYGIYSNAAVPSIPGGTTVYTAPTAISQNNFADTDFSIYPNPAADLIAVQVNGLVGGKLKVELIDISGRLVRQTIINAGQTIAHFDTQTLYTGVYFVRITDRNKVHSKKIEIQRN